MQKQIVLLHGWGATSSKLEPLEASLNKLGWKTQNIKLPGFELPVPNIAWNLDDYVNYVLGEIKFKGEYVLFGHSFGGRVAIKMAVSQKGNLAGIALCAAGGLSRLTSWKRYLFLILAKIGKLFLIIPSLGNLLRRVIYRVSGGQDYNRASGIMKEILKNIVSERLELIIQTINIPTLILWGTEDKVTPFSDALLLKQKIKNAKLVRFADHGHRLPYELPEKIAEEINIWSE